MNIEEITKNFKDRADLVKFAESQYELIVKLSKDINKLEEEKLVLKRQIDTQGIVTNKTDLKDLESKLAVTSDAESICLMQLKLLRDKSLEGELTLEECKKTEIYTKVLNSLKEKDISKNIDKTVDTKSLLTLVEE
jgi:hypothetical protein